MTTTSEHKLVRFELGWKGSTTPASSARWASSAPGGWEAVSTLQPSLGAAATDIVVMLKRTP